MTEPKVYRSLSQIKTAINDKVEEVLEREFQWTTVERWIMDMLKEHVEDTLMHALGYEWDEHRSHGAHWRLGDRGKRGVLRVIHDMAKNLANEHVPTIIEDYKATVLARLNSPKNVKWVRRAFEDEFNECIENELTEYAKQNAQLEVKKLFELHGQEFLDSIKIKNPVTLNAISVIAGISPADDDEDYVQDDDDE